MPNGWPDPYFEYPGLEKRARPKAPPPPPTPPPSPPEEEEPKSWWERESERERERLAREREMFPWPSLGDWAWPDISWEWAKWPMQALMGEEFSPLRPTGQVPTWGQPSPVEGALPAGYYPEGWGPAPPAPPEPLRTFGGYERAYLDKPVREIPEDVGALDPMAQVSWLNSNAYGSIYTDESGRIMTGGEAQRMMIENPNAQVTKVWFMGGDSATEVSFAARDLNTIEEMGLTEGQVGEMMLAAPEMATRRQSLAEYETGKAKILVSDLTYEEKVSALIDLYTDIKGGVTEAELAQLRTDVFESLPPEEQRARYQGWRPVAGEEPELLEWKAPKDVGKLTGAVSPFGITVLADYPYLSPITEAHLRRLPQPVLEMMSRYLEERGLAWRDWLALSMGGGAMPGRMPAWGIPRQ